MGRRTGEGWQSGLMDEGSWVEMQRDWARTVIVGRARLGGCPVGESCSASTLLCWHTLNLSMGVDRVGVHCNDQQFEHLNLPALPAALHAGMH